MPLSQEKVTWFTLLLLLGFFFVVGAVLFVCDCIKDVSAFTINITIFDLEKMNTLLYL